VPDAQLHSVKQQVARLFVDADGLYRHLRDSDFDRELAIQAEFARYLCVRVSGLFDASVGHILAKHIGHAANRKTVQRFAVLKLGNVTNLNARRLLKLFSEFDDQWRRDLEVFLDQRRKDALDSLVANRNNIAHGRPTTVTFSRVTEFHSRVTEVIDFIDNLVPN
jgi:hypothetical protein